MNWSNLLSSTRTREIETGQPPQPVSSREARTEFDRDYDRAVFSSPVRRLQDKAQVWPLERNDFVRTRLTHSMEVSAVARGLARRVARELRARNVIDDDQGHSLQMVAATCGLLHDLGNPPYGHAGEDAMQGWFKKRLEPGSALVAELGGVNSVNVQDFLKFDGNAQTVRLLAHLQMLADLSGLNLTAATLSSLMKYTAASTDTSSASHSLEKPGYFASEAKLIKEVRELLGTGPACHPLALLVEASDDIVYSAVDIEDGLRKQTVSWESLLTRLVEEGASDQLVQRLADRSVERLERGGLRLKGADRDEALVQIFRTYAIAANVEAAADAFMGKNYNGIMNGTFDGELLKSGTTASLISACKKVGRKDVYPAKSILRLEVMGRKVITDLCDLFWEGVQRAPDPPKGFSAKLYQLISANYRHIFETNVRGGENSAYCRLQLVADYVSGMTDTFATDLHKQMANG